MFTSPTVFIIGAGASLEAGLPTGVQLKKEIANKLYIKTDDWMQRRLSDHVLSESIILLSRNMQQNLNTFYAAARHIHDAMPQATSIDSFIDSQRDDKHIELVGKIAIVRSILEAEHRSKMYHSQTTQSSYPFSNLENTWYERLWHVITNNISKAEVNHLFDNVTFIVFNYDRCLEHYLYHSIRNYYNVDEMTAMTLMSKLKIFHPYGTVGNLEWQGGAVISFGSDNYNSSTLITLSQQIKTYTQRIQEESLLNSIHNSIEQANTLVFLGFKFHDQNMKLLKPAISPNVSRVFATAKGISSSDCKIVIKQIMHNFGEIMHDNLHLRNDLTCESLFDEYSRSLALG